ncbi:MAG: response regulator [Beijerinckiaceae bacterium]|nr:response regulator [Beijerinckiaceae bacterium]
MSKTELPLAGKACFVLEDEFLIALDLQDVLEQAGAAVTCFANADDALAALEKGVAFHVALLDVQLGGSSRTSHSVAAALSERKIPFIFLTGMRRDVAQLASYPDAPLLEKPYQQEALLAAIRTVLTR